MRRELGRVQRILTPLVSKFFILICVLLNTPHLHGQILTEQNDVLKVGYEERLRFYLDQKTKNYLSEMAARETVLLQMIQNIFLEVKKRDIAGIQRDDANFSALYHDLESMISEYSRELDAVLNIIEEVRNLEKAMDRQSRYGMAEQFAAIRDSLVTLIDNRGLHRLLPATTRYAADMIQEYNVEIDSLLGFYHKLDKIEREAKRTNNTELINKIAEQKRMISRFIDEEKNAQSDSVDSKLTETYIEEAQQMVTLLTELNELQKKALEKDPEYITEVELVKRNIMSNVDARILELFGMKTRPAGITLSERYKQWRSARLAKYEAKFAEYLVMKKALIEHGNDRQRARMLERDVSDAMLNYANRKYEVAERQFDILIRDYSPYFSNFEAVYFFKAESQYARLQYEQAFKSYSELLEKYPSTQYKTDAYLRLLTIAQTLNKRTMFFKRLAEVEKFIDKVPEQVKNRIYYLAGYYSLQLKKIRDAENYLSRISTNSKYYYPGLYLKGIALANRKAYQLASKTFLQLVNANNMPWSQAEISLIKNNALLRLGFIQYERGKYETAYEYFNKVSRGVDNRDEVLIGMAWAQMKSGEYEDTINNVQNLFQNYLSSNYTYEALVLSAHCKRLLNQPEDALQELRYVTNARGVLELANKYNSERAKLLKQIDELERMEEQTLENQDSPLYQIIAEIKMQAQQRLLNLGRTGAVGSTMLQDFDSERKEIYRQIKELDDIIETAKRYEKYDVLATASKRRERLVKALAAYQSDKKLKHVNYFLDFPLATRESATKYRAEIVKNILREMQVEKRRIVTALEQAEKLLEAGKTTSKKIDFVALKEDLDDLQDRIDKFQTWLSTYEIEEINTDFDHWADFSGFGLSDITIQELKKRERKISDYSDHISAIESLMSARRSVLEERLSRFDNEIDRIREKLEDEQLKLQKLEHEKIFNKYYFDTTVSETEKPQG